jgi:pyroglutamyl-peptidase
MAAEKDERPIVLLTGFGPFPSVPINASGEFVRVLADRARRAFPDFRFAMFILPTAWRHAPRRIAYLQAHYRPTLALHFGVAASAQGIRLETCAANVCRPSPDVAGLPPIETTLCPDGPMTRTATIPVAAIDEVLKASGGGCILSDDAGGYLCNAVLYHSLASAEVRGSGMVGFVHIPKDVSAQSMDEMGAAALEIIRVSLRSGSTRG